MSIRARLAVGVALMTMLVVMIVAGVQFAALRSFLSGGERARLGMLLPQLEAQLSRPGAVPAGAVERVPRTVDVRILRGAVVLARTSDFPDIPTSVPPGFSRRAGHEVLVGSVVIAGQPGVIQLASDVLRTVDPLGAYLRSLALVAPVSALLAGVLSFLLAGTLIAPLRRLEAAAERVGTDGEWRRPLPVVSHTDELGRLAGVLQRVFAQVAALREREALFMQAAAHDLRSPLTAVKARLQGALAGPRTAADLREDIHEALSDVERVQRLGEHLLLLAQGERDVQRQTLDLAALAGAAVDRARELRPDVQLDFETRGDTAVRGDPTLLTQVLTNLLENAQHHGEAAPVLVTVAGAGGHVTLTVRDRGPGVPQTALPHLTQPFYRRDPARSGHHNGLGLAIVERIVLAHHGTLQLTADRGLLAQVTLPAAGRQD